MVAVYISRKGFSIMIDKDSVQKVKDYYNNVQSSYNSFWMNKRNLAMHLGFWDKNTKSQHDALINENRYIANALNINQNDIVLDAGCGVGGTAIWIAEEYGARVSGVSIMENQIELAKKYTKDRGVDDLVDFRVKNYIETGFPDESFTKIYAMESVCHAENKEEFFAEAYRLLKKDGELAFIDEFVTKDKLNKNDQKLLNDWLVGWAVPNMLTAKEFKDGLKRMGFKNIKDSNVTKKVIKSSSKIQMVGLLFYPYDLPMSKLGIVPIETYNSTIACIRQKTLFTKNIVDFRLITCQK